MLTTIVEILLAVFWMIMLFVIIHENKGDDYEMADHVGLWVMLGIFGVLGIFFL